MDINEFYLARSAYLFKKKKKLTKVAIEEIINNSSKNRVGNYINKEISIDSSFFSGTSNFLVSLSYAVFKTKTSPSFLKNSDLININHNFIVLIEMNDALAVIGKKPSLNQFLEKEFLESFDYKSFCCFKGDGSPDYEKISMNNMSISREVIRSRTLEGASLDGAVSSSSTRRSIPKSFRLSTRVGECFDIYPEKEKIAESRGGKHGLNSLVNWCVHVVDSLKKEGDFSGFIDKFASPICLEDIAKSAKICAIIFEVSELENKLFGNFNAKLIFIKNTEGSEEELSDREVKKLFNVLRQTLTVKENKVYYRWLELPVSITPTKNLIKINSAFMNKILIEKDGKKTKLLSYINDVKPFSAMFTSPSYSYFSRSCFKDEELYNNPDFFLNVFHSKSYFDNVNSEKEKDHADFKNFNRFHESSLFRAIEDNYCKDCVVFCDDMSDEWADHIAIRRSEGRMKMSFIHSKFVKKLTYGASAFHEVVSQALKNIGRLQAESSEFEKKYIDKWSHCYEKTNINRTIGIQTSKQVRELLDDFNSRHDSIREVVLATPFLIKKDLENIFNRKKYDNIKSHHVQLIWLIGAFINTCKENGIQPVILCK